MLFRWSRADSSLTPSFLRDPGSLPCCVQSRSKDKTSSLLIKNFTYAKIELQKYLFKRNFKFPSLKTQFGNFAVLRKKLFVNA